MKKIALISDGWRRLITYAWVDGIMRRIRELGEDITLYQYNCYGNWSRDALNNAGEYNIYNLPDFTTFDGIILDGSNIVDQKQRRNVVKLLKQSGVPVLSLDWYVEGFYYVGADNRKPIRELIEHLYEVHGCRSFAFAGGPEDAFGNLERLAAYCEALEQYGLSIDDNTILCGDYDYETGVRYMQEYGREKKQLPDAFVCANDNIAAGICAEAENWGYRVPDDFLVTGFDNLDKAAYFRPQITTVCQDREDIGARCVDLLRDLWNGEKIDTWNYIQVECIYAESCGCPNNGRVDYREHIRNQIISSVQKDEEDALLVELEAQMARCSDFDHIFEYIIDYFQKLSCDGTYIVVDRKLFIADEDTQFPVVGYDRQDLVVADGFENHKRMTFDSVNDLDRHLEETAGGNAYLFTPIHFRNQAVGYIVMKNGRFLYDNPYYYDIHSTLVKVLETQFKQKQVENVAHKLKLLYNRDPLTGICNRIAYSDMIGPAFQRYVQQRVRCALVFVDADDFKSINDTYGHEFGDQVLIGIAHVLEEECPDDGYVCRYGGDEFLAFFPYATEANTDAYVKRVQERLEKENIQISMGVKLTDLDQEGTLDSYLSLADQNMYENKQHRKEEKRNAIDKIK